MGMQGSLADLSVSRLPGQQVELLFPRLLQLHLQLQRYRLLYNRQ